MSWLRHAGRWNNRRFATITTIAFLPAYLLFVFWRWWANTDPHVRVPEPVMPVPNAHDTYVAAAKGLVRAEDIRFAASGRSHKGHLHTLQEKEALVRANAPVLRAARRGLAQVYHAPPMRSFSTDYPYLRSLRCLGSAFNLEGQVKAAHSDYSGAMDSYLDAVEFGQDAPRGSVLLGRLVGNAMQSIGRRSAWDVVPHLDAATARRTARRMEAIAAREFPYTETLREEMWGTQASLLELFRNNDHLRFTSYDAEDQMFGCSADSDTDRRIALLFHLYGKRRTYENYTAYMERSIEQARLPYAAHAPDPPLPPDPLNEYLCPGFTLVRFKDAGNQTQNSLLTVALALQAYRAEQGRYPKALSELAPQYVKRIPDDPFALKGSLRYRRTGDAKYVLYSVGPDGVDDGGRAIYNPMNGQEARKRHHVDKDSKGDVVAGVNS